MSTSTTRPKVQHAADIVEAELKRIRKRALREINERAKQDELAKRDNPRRIIRSDRIAMILDGGWGAGAA